MTGTVMPLEAIEEFRLGTAW